MSTPVASSKSAPATFEALSIEQLLMKGRFFPASVQRSFVWGEPETIRLLDDLEKLLQRMSEDGEPDAAADAAAAEDATTDQIPDDGEASTDAQSLGIGDAAPGSGLAEPQDDFAIGEDAANAVAMEAAVTPADTSLSHYFIGNMILRESESGVFEIFDGLQRFTVVTVLLAILRDMAVDPLEKQRLHLLVEGDSGFRLRHFGHDRTLVTHIQPMGATPQKTDRRLGFEIGRRIIAVKLAIEKRLLAWSPERRSRFAQLLLGSVWAGAMHVPDPRVARQMFVSTNQHGKRLELTDVLKGQLFDLASRVDGGAYGNAFAKQWTDLQVSAGEMFPEALKAFDAIERALPQDATWPTDLGEFAGQAYPGDSFPVFAKRLRAFTFGWKDCRRVLSLAGRERVERDLWRLHVFRWTEWHGLALSWWQELYQERKRGTLNAARMNRFISRFDRLHRRCMAITLARCDEPLRQKIFARALAQHRNGQDVFTLALTLSEKQRRTIDRTLQTEIHDREIWAPLIRWIEISEWRPGLPDLVRLSNTEHVRPRRPDWGDELTGDLPRYNEGCFSLGNLAVISRKMNDDVMNDDFAGKLPSLRSEAKKFRTMHSVVFDEAGNERAEWSNEIILKRAELLRATTWKLLRLKPPERNSPKETA